MESDLIEELAQLQWALAGAVIPWERADPVVQERYREKARKLTAGS